MSIQNTRAVRPLTFLAGLLIAVLALACSAQGQSLQKGTSAALPAANLSPAEPYSYVYLDPLEASHSAPKVDDGQRQNFQLHGHWVIDVKNADGSIAQHRDFENTIQGGGAAYLIGLMAGYVVPSDYEIFLQSVAGTAPCTPPGLYQGCAIVRSLTTTPGSNTCPNYFCALGLTYTYNQSSTTALNSMVLAGSFTASRAGTIDNVSTYVGSCPVSVFQTTLTTISPAACNAAVGSTGVTALSGASITSVPVVASQIVQVTVTISFS